MGNAVDRRDITPEELAAAQRYAIVIEWSPEDDAFVVSVPDIAGLHTHGATREEAAMMGDEAIAVWLAADQKLGIEAPTPRFSALGSLSKGAERIRRIRHSLNVSQREFADLLNVSLSTVRSWEQGVRTPDGSSLRLLDIAEREPEVLTATAMAGPRHSSLSAS